MSNANRQLDKLVEKLKAAHAENLVSVVLYGSAAIEKQANKNILVVLERITPADLKLAHSIARRWCALGNPMPLYFTREEIENSSDVFPIEFIDMSRMRRVLLGPDPFDRLQISTQNLRHQLEYELRGKLIRLRQLYIPASHNSRRLARLMSDSLNSFAVLFRHLLWMRGVEATADKKACVMKLSELLGLDEKVFLRIFKYADEEETPLEAQTEAVFAAYLVQIEKVIESVDR
jgi:hypothetical protein